VSSNWTLMPSVSNEC